MRALPRAATALCTLLAVGSLVGCGSASRDPVTTSPVRQQLGHSGLVTNEYAYRNPQNPGRHLSPYWIATSGSLFAQDGAGWTGIPDRTTPNAQSSNGTDSAVFRLVSRRRNLGNVRVTCQLFIQRHASVPGSEPHSYDGVHIWLRYTSDTELYALSVMRWDGLAVIKRKTPGGSSNGGTYTALASVRSPMPTGRWVSVDVEAINRRGRVELTIIIAGRTVLRAVDSGPHAITRPGAVGIRADNTEFKFRDFEARPVRG